MVSCHFDSSAGQVRLTMYAQQLSHVFKHREITLHGMCRGCAISLAFSGVDMSRIMDHVGWKTTSSAHHYIKLTQVVHPSKVGDTLASLLMNLTELYQKKNDLIGFTQAF